MSIMGNNCGFDDGLWLFAILALMGFGGNGFGYGNNRVGEAYATQADIQRAVDLNAIMKGQGDIERVVSASTSTVTGSIKDGNYNILGELRDVQSEAVRGFSAMKDCCCDIKSAIMENRYLAERNTNVITNAIHADGEATRALMNQTEKDRLRDELYVSRAENSNMRQNDYILAQMGHWYSNPPCRTNYGCCNNQ